jgi:hypothetical protein
MQIPEIGNNNPAPLRFTKDAMKRMKRLTIEFRHREVTITLEGSTLHVQDSEPGAADALTVCPICGSFWITIAALAEGDIPTSVDRIHQVLQQSGLHVQVSAAGRLQICQKSFEEIKEKL